ncbi:MAG: HDOD domain-containing protein [Pontiellaceae bacterium]|nr:HDOD domain-containing protein [Pontiellaceae bacterium]
MNIPPKYRILFVDDEPNILSGIRRLLRPHRDEWEMEFANSGAEALERLKEHSFHLVVSDLRMPGMSGVELLSEIKKQYPQVIRFILSGHGETDMLIQSVGVAHQFLSKPCNDELFKEALTRAVTLVDLFDSDALRKVIGDGSTLPTLPELYRELSRALQAPGSSIEKITAIIKRDVVISAKVIQLVNSAFFSLQRRVESISEAITLLGSETLNSLVLACNLFDRFDENTVNEFGIRKIYAHSVAVGGRAQRIILHQTKDRKLAEEAMLAGILHDIGKLALIKSRNPEWRSLYLGRTPDSKPLHILEKEVLGVTHAEVGAYLVGLWGLSNNIIEAVAFHDTPSLAPEPPRLGSLCALYLANMFENQKDGEKNIPFDIGYLEKANILESKEILRECSESGFGVQAQQKGDQNTSEAQ